MKAVKSKSGVGSGSDELTVVPALGRDYKSAKAAVQDWVGGRVFLAVGPRLLGGRFVREADVPGVAVKVRYRLVSGTRWQSWVAVRDGEILSSSEDVFSAN